MNTGIWGNTRLFEGIRVCPHMTDERINYLLFLFKTEEDIQKRANKKFMGKSYVYFFQETEEVTTFWKKKKL